MFTDVCQRKLTSTHIIIVIDGFHVVVKRLARLLVQLGLNSLLVQFCQLLLLLNTLCLKCLVSLLKPLHQQPSTGVTTSLTNCIVSNVKAVLPGTHRLLRGQ